jgi:hypothetical protein
MTVEQDGEARAIQQMISKGAPENQLAVHVWAKGLSFGGCGDTGIERWTASLDRDVGGGGVCSLPSELAGVVLAQHDGVHPADHCGMCTGWSNARQLCRVDRLAGAHCARMERGSDSLRVGRQTPTPSPAGLPTPPSTRRVRCVHT